MKIRNSRHSLFSTCLFKLDLNISLAMASISTTLLLAGAVLGTLVNGLERPDVSTGLQEILNKAHQGPLYDYPTSLTQGIVPVSFVGWWYLGVT